MKKNKNIAFTLTEIMVIIVIIGIIGTLWSSIFFKWLDNKQRIDYFTNETYSQIEQIRNLALFGKTLDSWNIKPEAWRILVSNSWTWKLISQYFSWSNRSNYKELNIKENYYIWDLEIDYLLNSEDKCSYTWSSIWTWEIIFSWTNISINDLSTDTTCDNEYKKILRFDTIYKTWTNKKSIEFNSINWIIEIK